MGHLYRKTATFVRDVAVAFKRDGLQDSGGAIAFFGMLALFPFLIFLVSLVGLILDPGVTESLVADLREVSPGPVTEIVGGQLASLSRGGKTGLLTIGFVGAFWAASNGVAAVMRALNRVFGCREERPFWKVRLIALATTAGAALVILLAALLMVVLPAALPDFPGRGWILLVRFPVAGLMMMLIWAVLFNVLPDTCRKFQVFTPGSIAGVLLWILASWGFSEYVNNFGKYQAIYGTLGGVAVLLLWLYISGVVFLLGAEINAVLDPVCREAHRRAG
ncbi:MAG TPA: YihY/virulence factor BrkB family protein [Vulgatibacter sp.]|nr:YihY/virulence factor BrkB family protein [Vulgatibacter sp.]